MLNVDKSYSLIWFLSTFENFKQVSTDFLMTIYRMILESQPVLCKFNS